MFNKEHLNSIKKNCFILFFLILLSSHFSTAESSNSDQPFSKIQNKIEKNWKNSKAPSVAISVAKDGEIIWEKAFGLANIENKIEATPNTMYSLASISKPITATGLMILVERGLVKLDKPVNDYLGKAKLKAYEGNVSDATVQRVLHHTAGLPTHWNFYLENEQPQRPCMDESIQRFGFLVSPPGEKYNYSNFGYGIIDYVIERVSKQSYPEFMKTEVFEPLGLSRMAIFTKAQNENFVAQRYCSSGKRSSFYDFDHRGASAVYSSAHDLVRFGMFHLNDKPVDQISILSRETVNKMQTLTDPKVPYSDYRLGWSVSERFGYKLVSHSGGMTGVRTTLYLIPSENLVIAVLSNGETIDTNRIADWIIEELLPFHERAGNWITEKLFPPQNETLNKGISQPLKKTSGTQASVTMSNLTGQWEGEIKIDKINIPIRVKVESKKKVWLSILTDSTLTKEIHLRQKLTPVRAEDVSVRLTGGMFSAAFPIVLPIKDIQGKNNWVHLNLKVRDNRASGYTMAYSSDGLFGLPFHTEIFKK